jgi:ABC-type multidrug transport system ATPase subunit
MTVVVHTRQLTKDYGRLRALDHLDLNLHSGEVYGLLGPNGAGKTTAIRLLMDLIRPTRGRIVLFGEELATRSVRARRRIGYVPGDLALYDRLTGEDHLRLFARLRDHPDLTEARVPAKRLDLDLGRRAGARRSPVRRSRTTPGSSGTRAACANSSSGRAMGARCWRCRSSPVWSPVSSRRW